MLKKCRNILRNEKGLTLIELLAVVVILGIIAAIAIPSIGNIIDNSRKDAHVANAQMVINSARLAALDNTAYVNGTIQIGTLISGNYLEQIEDPDGGTYTSGSVTLAEGKVTSVTLVGAKRTISAAAGDNGGNLIINRDSITSTTP
ncbi:prepilin-type N-terminal cleavage/methylation domain-containing protein [Bacillus alkalisoli]|uniref:prepilin-type N-terminal cleavage/methylation domain-containing protein n=1 Tax=Bacillus alkalisoli TaxID=2011008 RepID=UPI000C2468F3|nr:prepilin-type N-terminal cleavage/methylation domain-containing protein [Bacillus alkalisoli]